MLPARLIGQRARSGGKWEGLFLGVQNGAWELLTQTRGRLIVGETILVDPQTPANGAASAPLRLCLVGKSAAGRWLARPEEEGQTITLLARFGRVPLPPYIRKGRASESDSERYQTVYARQLGAVAAPTAGLHFTPRMFDALAERGVERTFVTLHVGAGTFQPVSVEDVTQHNVQAEWGEAPAAAAQAVAACKARGRRVVAVGTTSVARTGDGWGNAVVRLDGLDHPTAVRVPSGGCVGDELSSTAFKPAAADGGLRWVGNHAGGVSTRRGERISVLFLWRRDVDFVTWEGRCSTGRRTASLPDACSRVAYLNPLVAQSLHRATWPGEGLSFP